MRKRMPVYGFTAVEATKLAVSGGLSPVDAWNKAIKKATVSLSSQKKGVHVVPTSAYVKRALW